MKNLLNVEKVSERNKEELKEIMKRMKITHFRPFIAPDMEVSKEAIITGSLELLKSWENGEMTEITKDIDNALN
jgi:predicted ATPase with chaperone activity